MREHFDASVAEVQATFSVSLVMFAFGILAWGPFSDRYGRRAAVLGGLGIMIAGAAVIAAGAEPRLRSSRAVRCRPSARPPAS